MRYEDVLDEIYNNYKKESNYSDIKFIKENNTNIVKYETSNLKNTMVKGFIVEQSHIVLINFNIEYKEKIYTVFSKAYISEIGYHYHAIIYNCLLNQDKVISKQTIGRYFKNRNELYKQNNNDIVINENVFDECYEDVMKNLNKAYTYKKDYK